MKKLFQEPEMNLQAMEVEDVITTSFTYGDNETPGVGL